MTFADRQFNLGGVTTDSTVCVSVDNDSIVRSFPLSASRRWPSPFRIALLLSLLASGVAACSPIAPTRAATIMHAFASPDAFLALGKSIMRHERTKLLPADERRFQFHAMFGTSPFNCSLLWWKLDIPHLPKSARPKHLLWALMFTSHKRSLSSRSS